jgi:iron transport multicopper oxidase
VAGLICSNTSYWIHGHNHGQYVDGLRTSLIIKCPTSSYHDLPQYTFTFGDWYHEEHSVLIDQYLNSENPAGNEPVPDSALINDGAPSDITFVAGQKYVLNLISVSAFAAFQLYMEHHTFTVVEVDGVEVVPYVIDGLPIAAAQRYVVIVQANADPTFNYRLFSKIDQTMLPV